MRSTSRSGGRLVWSVAVVVLIASVAPAVAAGGGERFRLDLAVVTDYVYRGISQSDEGPGGLAGAAWEHEIGFFASLWLATVDYRRPGDDRDVEARASVGWGWGLRGDWSLAMRVTRYDYPGARHDDYAYTELDLGVQWSDRFGASVAWADDVLGRGGDGWVGELTAGWPLPAKLRLVAGVGYSSWSAPLGLDYAYWNVGLARRFRRVTLDLTWVGTDDEAGRFFGDLAGDRLVGGVSVRLF